MAVVSSVQFSHSVLSDSLRPHGLQHTRPPCPSPTHGVYSSSCPSSRWCHPTISSSVIPFSSCLQSFPASGSFLRVSSNEMAVSICQNTGWYTQSILLNKGYFLTIMIIKMLDCRFLIVGFILLRDFYHEWIEFCQKLFMNLLRQT